jgi:excinuclease ABC subunit A
MNHITVTGARSHNLKNVSLAIPKNALVVFTGLSGSGKSSLAFDTIYAEGQRRYVESLSAYARQFLEQLDKPDVDRIEGLSPAISIDQKNASTNPRSTVGTVTEIQDYVRLLYTNIGVLHCPISGNPVAKQSVQDMANELYQWHPGKGLVIMAPLITQQKGEFHVLFSQLMRQGFARVRVNGTIKRLEDCGRLPKNNQHTIELVIDRIDNIPENQGRLFEAVELAIQQSKGLLMVWCPDTDEFRTFSEHFVSPDYQFTISELTPRLFSFNSPIGACSHCKGLGYVMAFDPDTMFRDGETVADALSSCINVNASSYMVRFQADAHALDIPIHLNAEMAELTDKERSFVLYGRYGDEIEIQPSKRGFPFKPRGWEGIINLLRRRHVQTDSELARSHYESTMVSRDCDACHGHRLNQEALAVKIRGVSIGELGDMAVSDAKNWIHNLDLSPQEQQISSQLIKEIGGRLAFLDNVGLHYLTLNRRANTLSGGEHQRIRLATQIGSGLTGVLYVLDEPSIGLHQRDNDQLIATIKHLRDLGNTVIIVEHDEDTIRASDHVVDIGPLAGQSGGHIVHNGDLASLLTNKASITGQYLSGERRIQVPTKRRNGHPDHTIVLHGASANNLKKVTFRLPLGTLTCVTGVSGSGKSTLVYHTLREAILRELHHRPGQPQGYNSLEGASLIDNVITIDQSAIGRTPRSNPATYVGFFSAIRDVFAELPESKMNGFKPGRFSFNVRGGRCETCQGAGVTKVEMHFLTDIFVTCTTCKGQRFNDQILGIRFKGHNINDVLNMTINQALDVFDKIPYIHNRLTVLKRVGLGYITLGQSATTVSGGEAQRIKLAKELSKRSTGKTLYLLDEPTTGLHFDDINRLMEVIQELVDVGNTVLVIEHNLDVIKCADYIVDMGPGGGAYGGQIVCEGAPEVIANHPDSETGRYLKKILAMA